MSVTEWKYRVYVITTNKALGQSLAELAAAFPDDPNAEVNTFEDRLQTSPQGWAVVIPARQEFVDIVNAINEDVGVTDPRLSELRNRGLTASLWGQAKQSLVIEWQQAWFDDGSFVPTQTLEEFCTSKGYTLIVASEEP